MSTRLYIGMYPVKISAPERSVTSYSPAETALEKLGQKLSRKLAEKSADLFAWCLKAKQETLLELLAYCVGKSSTAHGSNVEPLGVDVRRWFTPDAADYFGRVGKEQILKDMAECAVTENLSSLKKAELAKTAAKLVTDDWVPEPMPAQQTAPEADETEEDYDEMGEAA